MSKKSKLESAAAMTATNPLPASAPAGDVPAYMRDPRIERATTLATFAKALHDAALGNNGADGRKRPFQVTLPCGTVVDFH